MKSYTFTLILSGVAELTPALADALYEATHGDIELNLREGVAFADFERKAATLRAAITSAIREVEQAAAGVRVVRVESEAANVITKINADLLGVVSGG
jgi:regulator of protease activity HflC (stomatin/prohibitin superfamily)